MKYFIKIAGDSEVIRIFKLIRSKQFCLVFFMVILAGCSSATLPKKLSDYQSKEISNTKLPATVGVEAFMFPVYSERLIKGLRSAGVFQQVDALNSFDTSPTYIARVNRTIYGSTAIPWWTLISFGIIPMTVEEEWGYSFTLTESANPSNTIDIEFSYKGPTTLGWWAIILNLLPDRTVFDPYESDRLSNSLAWEIIRHVPK